MIDGHDKWQSAETSPEIILMLELEDFFFKAVIRNTFKDINEIVLIIDLRKRKLYQRNKTARNAKCKF